MFVEGLIQGNITSEVGTREGLVFVEGLIQGGPCVCGGPHTRRALCLWRVSYKATSHQR